MAKGYWSDEKKFFQEYNKPDEKFEFDLGDDWNKERAKGQRRDIINKGKRLGLEFVQSQPMGSWEEGIIRGIDQARGREEANDIMPGVIKDGRVYRCSKFIPGHGCIKASFADESSAVTWMNNINENYKRFVR